MADVTINPEVLGLELTLHEPTVIASTISVGTLGLELTLHEPYVGVAIVAVSTLGLELTLHAPVVAPLFPTLSKSPQMESFVDEYSSETVVKDTYSSGYPLLNPQFTLDLKNWTWHLRDVSEEDKIIVMSFYNNHKKRFIIWSNEQDDTPYAVIFLGKPDCQLDTANDLWKIAINFKQAEEL